MGMLRKYLWLVLPIVFFANYASADTCENNPYACTPAKLCSKTTEKINNVLYWISSEEDKHLKVAQQINLNCGAKDAMSSCQKDASQCSILELCEVAATKDVSATNWNEMNPQHVKLAKSFGLDCGVKKVQGINKVNKINSNTAKSPCDVNPLACKSEELCEKATYGVVGNKNWTTPKVFADFVKEAKQRGLTCGVKSTSIDKTCSQDVLNCTPAELCETATYNINGITGWKLGSYKKFVDEAKRRNISCGVNLDKKSSVSNKTTLIRKKVNTSKARCEADLKGCTDYDLCMTATFKVASMPKNWKLGSYKKFVDEAKRRNISCGVKSASNDQVKADEKARLALEAEKKRKADKKARLALDAKKARLALEAEKKRKADEKARIALKAENKQLLNLLERDIIPDFIALKKKRAKKLLNSNKQFNFKLAGTGKILPEELLSLYAKMKLVDVFYKYFPYQVKKEIKNYDEFKVLFPDIERNTARLVRSIFGEEQFNRFEMQIKKLEKDHKAASKANNNEWHYTNATAFDERLWALMNCLKAEQYINVGCEYFDSGMTENEEKLFISAAYLNRTKQMQNNYYQSYKYSRKINQNNEIISIKIPKSWSQNKRKSGSKAQLFTSFAGYGAEKISIEINSNVKDLMGKLEKNNKILFTDNILEVFKNPPKGFIKLLSQMDIDSGCIPLQDMQISHFNDDSNMPVQYHKQFCTFEKNDRKAESLLYKYQAYLNEEWIIITCQVALAVNGISAETNGKDIGSTCRYVSDSAFNDAYEKAKLALKAEKKREADEKARLALKAEKKRKADEKARLATETKNNSPQLSFEMTPEYEKALTLVDKKILEDLALFKLMKDYPACPSTKPFHNCFGAAKKNSGDILDIALWKSNAAWTGIEIENGIYHAYYFKGTYFPIGSCKQEIFSTKKSFYYCPNGDKFRSLEASENKDNAGKLIPVVITKADGSPKLTDYRVGRWYYEYASSGDVYEGDYLNDQKTGKGIYKWANGNVYEGDFLNGQLTGKGIFKKANGDVYEGDWINGQLQ